MRTDERLIHSRRSRCALRPSSAVVSSARLGPGDSSLGLALAVAEIGSPFREAQQRLGLSVDSREVNVELTYRTQPTSWLAVQPDIQYVISPSGDPELEDALVLGVRFEFSWSRAFGR